VTATLADLLHRALTALAARALPWSSRSQQDSWHAGYVAGCEDMAQRRRKTTP
jgi:hypothetical protein